MAYVVDGQLPIGATHPNLGSNLSADGIISFETVGENVLFGELLYLHSNGKYYKALADSDEKMPVTCMAVWQQLSGKVCPVLMQGFVRNDSWNFALPNKVYIDKDTEGLITISQPTDYNQIVGTVIKKNILYFSPESNYDYGYDTRNTIKDLNTDVKALFERQTFNVSLPIWAAGDYTMLNGGRHARLSILDAWVEVKDNSDQNQTIEIVGFSDILNIPETYSAGVAIPLDMIRGELGFGENVIVKASTNRRVTVELMCESDE